MLSCQYCLTDVFVFIVADVLGFVTAIVSANTVVAVVVVEVVVVVVVVCVMMFVVDIMTESLVSLCMKVIWSV